MAIYRLCYYLAVDRKPLENMPGTSERWKTALAVISKGQRFDVADAPQYSSR